MGGMRIREVVVGVRPHFELDMENGVLTTTVRRCPPFGSLGAGGVGGALRCVAVCQSWALWPHPLPVPWPR